MDALLTTSATELARRIRTGEVSSRTVVDAHIARIEAVNPTLNAVVADRFDAARAEADAADAAVAAGEELPPLHGVPCTIKECFAVEGMPWSGGLLARRDVTGPRDATTVARLREAGAIVMGVTNLSELCMWMESNNPVYGRTSNPYDPTRIVGGSSGGEGAIVGAGGSPFGLGSDVGGSIRMPAFFNGVFGHKPSPRLIPNTDQFPATHGEAGGLLLGSGPLARRAEDLMPLVRIMAGPDGEDPACRETPLGDPATVSLAGLRVLDVPDNDFLSVHPELRAAQLGVADWLARQGAVVSERRFPLLRRSFDIWSTAMGDAQGPAAFRSLLGRRRRELLLHVLRPAALGGAHTLPASILGLVEDVSTAFPHLSVRGRRDREALHRHLLEAMGDGVLLFPSYPEPAPKHGAPLLKPLHWVYTAVFNAMGFPVTQVPLGLGSDGVPLGVQIVGAPGNDHVTIAVAEALERGGVAGWVPPAT